MVAVLGFRHPWYLCVARMVSRPLLKIVHRCSGKESMIRTSEEDNSLPNPGTVYDPRGENLPDSRHRAPVVVWCCKSSKQ